MASQIDVTIYDRYVANGHEEIVNTEIEFRIVENYIRVLRSWCSSIQFILQL